MTETMTYMLSKDEGSDMELTLQQATAFQHLNLAQMTMTKPGIEQQRSSLIHDVSSEELTQMSCGRNLKEYFQASTTSYNLHDTSRSGHVSAQKVKVNEATAMQNLANSMMYKEDLLDSTIKKKRNRK